MCQLILYDDFVCNRYFFCYPAFTERPCHIFFLLLHINQFQKKVFDPFNKSMILFLKCLKQLELPSFIFCLDKEKLKQCRRGLFNS